MYNNCGRDKSGGLSRKTPAHPIPWISFTRSPCWLRLPCFSGDTASGRGGYSECEQKDRKSAKWVGQVEQVALVELAELAELVEQAELPELAERAELAERTEQAEQAALVGLAE